MRLLYLGHEYPTIRVRVRFEVSQVPGNVSLTIGAPRDEASLQSPD